MVCSPARSASQEIERLDSPTSTASPFRLLRKSSAASSLTRTPNASGETSVKSFGAGVMPSSLVWLSRNSFSLRSELSVEVTSVTAWPIVIWPRNSNVSPVGLRASLTVTGSLSPRLCAVPVRLLAVDGEIGDKAVLAVGTLRGGVADVERGRGDVLALPGFLQDDVGVAVHQAVDRGEIAGLNRARRRLGGKFHLGESEAREDRDQTEQEKEARAHMKFPETNGIGRGRK